MSYQPKVYRDNGGDRQVIAGGGEQKVESGGLMNLESGAGIKHAIQTKIDDYSVLASESGTTFLMGTDAKTFTLPSTVDGLEYTFVNSGADGNNILTISPAAADAIHGGSLSSVDDKDLINTKATSKEGDYVTIKGDGIAGWWIVGIEGIWAKE